MAEELEDGIGILPVGALGSAFFFHLTGRLEHLHRGVQFLERPGSATSAALRGGRLLRFGVEDTVRELRVGDVCRPGLLDAARSGWLPGLVLVCTNSDQLLPVITEWVALLEWLHAGEGLDAALQRLPVLILCSNGIYHLRVRRFLVESLEESMLHGRLPDLWSEPMGRIVAKLLRGVTIQTGQRDGTGPAALYRPGPLGRTRLAGGGPSERRRCGAVLKARGGWFDVEEEAPPTRVEFDKALLNLFANLLGLLQAIDAHGEFRLLRVGEIIPESENAATRELARHVIAVGRAVQAYRADEDFELLYHTALREARAPLQHIPSSLKWVQAELRAGTLRPEVPPTERWLLDPLIHYATTAGLEEAARYFDDLVVRIETCLRSALEAKARSA